MSQEKKEQKKEQGRDSPKFFARSANIEFPQIAENGGQIIEHANKYHVISTPRNHGLAYLP